MCKGTSSRGFTLPSGAVRSGSAPDGATVTWRWVAAKHLLCLRHVLQHRTCCRHRWFHRGARGYRRCFGEKRITLSVTPQAVSRCRRHAKVETRLLEGPVSLLSHSAVDLAALRPHGLSPVQSGHAWPCPLWSASASRSRRRSQCPRPGWPVLPTVDTRVQRVRSRLRDLLSCRLGRRVEGLMAARPDHRRQAQRGVADGQP